MAASKHDSLKHFVYHSVSYIAKKHKLILYTRKRKRHIDSRRFSFQSLLTFSNVHRSTSADLMEKEQVINTVRVHRFLTL